MTKTIYMFRHGQTDWNKEKRAQGQTHHVPLNETGMSQADELSERLSQVGLEMIYSSPLKRAFQTAEKVSSAAGVQVEPHDGLMERSFGLLEGCTWDEMLERFPEHKEDIINGQDKTHPNFKHIKMAGAESLHEVEERIWQAMVNIASKNEHQTIGISTHGTAMFSFLVRVLGYNDFPVIENCELMKLEWCEKSKRFTLLARGIKKEKAS